MNKELSFEEKLIEKDRRTIAPNIFIGLGGQGCKMVAWLSKKAKEEKSPAKNLSFVAIDTDVNELRKIKTISNDVVTVQTSSRMTIGEYLEYDDNARENWFPINEIILDKTPSEGAGQIRAISNLVAHNAIREGEFTAINDAIDSLFPLSDESYEQSIHVTIIGTLAGGTGSGLVLPVALYVKNYLEKIRQQKSSVIRGFFILPDVMHSVITSDVERENQYSNAYASIREIDALMRRPYDVELQKRYPNLKVIVPKVGGTGYDEFDDAPFNFCFLFNKINTKGTEIKSKDSLLHHAVECIYDMSISPICMRVNSQEDNIIREKISSGNKSSYAGAGASKLVYPYDAVVDYVALNWAKNSISKQWLGIDEHIQKKQQDINEKLNSGRSAAPFDKLSEIVDFVKSNADSAPFYKALVTQTQKIKPNSIEKEDKSTIYIGALLYYIEQIRNSSVAGSKAEKDRAKCLLQKKEASGENKTVGTSTEEIVDARNIYASNARAAVQTFLTCQQTSVLNAETISDIIADGIISADPEKNEYNDIPVLEKYMVLENSFMHPNAARYFLADISLKLKETINELNADFEGNNGVEKRFNDKVEEIKNLVTQSDEYDKRGLLQELLGNISKAQREAEVSERIQNICKIIEIMLQGSGKSSGDNLTGNEGMPLLDRYCKIKVYINVLSRVKGYIDDISEGFEEFYKKMSGDILAIPQKIADIEKDYANCEGIDTTYVCSSVTCLRRLNSSCKNTVGTYDLPKEFTRNIFEKAKEWAVKKEDGSLEDEYGINETANEQIKNKGINAFFGDVFNNIIMKFWRERVAKECESRLDMDVVTAIFKEASIEANCNDKIEKNSYLKMVISKAKSLSVPFIDAPHGVQRRLIRASSTNPVVSQNLSEENRKFFEEECLVEYNPEYSEDVSKHTIVFFTAIYNIAAKNLAKMVAPKESKIAGLAQKIDKGGLYFATYHDRIKRIEPLDKDNREISPHIQRDWQYINVLPEVDPEYQALMEKRIAKAFVYALISGKIGYRRHDIKGFNYCYELVDAKLRSPELIVSNGTSCDQFYEVLDALTICPRYVDRLLEMYESEKAFENLNGNEFSDTQFYKTYTHSFIIEEFSKEPIMNIFYIPILYKASAGANYLAAWGQALLAAIFEMIDDQIATFESKFAVDDIKCDFLIAIYKEFVNNFDKLIQLSEGSPDSVRKHSRMKRMSNDSITLRIFDEIAGILSAIDGKTASKDQYANIIDEIMEKRKTLSETKI